MTAAAVLEIQIAAEGSAAVVTGRARIVAGREVFCRPRGAHLSPLRQSGGVVVLVGRAASPHPRVAGMRPMARRAG